MAGSDMTATTAGTNEHGTKRRFPGGTLPQQWQGKHPDFCHGGVGLAHTAADVVPCGISSDAGTRLLHIFRSRSGLQTGINDAYFAHRTRGFH